MKYLLLCLGAAACASVSPVHDSAVLSRRGAAELPSAHALDAYWRSHEPLTAHVQLCVAPGGETVHVRLAQSSGDRTYDDAVVRDAATWSYEPFATSSGSPVCEPASVTYLP